MFLHGGSLLFVHMYVTITIKETGDLKFRGFSGMGGVKRSTRIKRNDTIIF